METPSVMPKSETMGDMSFSAYIRQSLGALPSAGDGRIRVDWLVLGTVMGILGALAALAYSFVISNGLPLLWTTLPELIHEHGLFDEAHCAWVVPTTMMVLWIFFARVVDADLPNMNLNKWIDAIVKDGGHVPPTFGLPVFVLSCTNIIGGSSIGPEAPVVFFGSALGSFVASWIGVDPPSTRCMSLCGGAGALSILFGFPIASALFALELPHPNGYEYFEFLPAVMWASIVGSWTSRVIKGTKMKCDPTKPGFYCFSYKVPPGVSNITIAQAVLYGVVAALVSLVVIFSIKQAKAMVQSCKVKYGVSSETCLIMGGMFIGCIGMIIPQTLFGGQFLLQSSLLADQDSYPVPWISPYLLEGSWIPLSNLWPAHYLIIAIAKVITISVCVAVGMCGGLVFPPMIVGAGISRVFFPGDDFAVVSIMGATLASVCRVPIGALLLLTLSMRLQLSELDVDNSIEVIGSLVTKVAISIFVASWLTSFYPLAESKSRTEEPGISKLLS